MKIFAILNLTRSITINKVQGLPLKLSSLGLDIYCSSHGQLFVVCSRVVGDDQINKHYNNNRRTAPLQKQQVPKYYQSQIETYDIFYKRRNHMTCVPTILPTPVRVEPATLRLGSGYATSKPPGTENPAHVPLYI
ncbi:hypothetical protein TNCV_3407671 [Trichonephila clavipes]|nr:hypothetical protein TNCV_3407671 [Trichonephila clavipes]